MKPASRGKPETAISVLVLQPLGTARVDISRARRCGPATSTASTRFASLLPPPAHPDHIAAMKKIPFRLTPYQVQFLLVVGFVTVGYAIYLRYLGIEFSTVALACDAGLQT